MQASNNSASQSISHLEGEGPSGHFVRNHGLKCVKEYAEIVNPAQPGRNGINIHQEAWGTVRKVDLVR